jgi:hypothetical protein
MQPLQQMELLTLAAAQGIGWMALPAQMGGLELLLFNMQAQLCVLEAEQLQE